MVNQHNQIVCDITHIILEDGICIYPNYVEVSGGRIFVHSSNDPHNSISPFLTNAQGETIGRNPEYTMGMLLNRKEFEQVQEITIPEVTGIPDGHYIDLPTMLQAVAVRKQIQETGEIPREPVTDTPAEIAPDIQATEISVPSEPTGSNEEIVTPEKLQEAVISADAALEHSEAVYEEMRPEDPTICETCGARKDSELHAMHIVDNSVN